MNKFNFVIFEVKAYEKDKERAREYFELAKNAPTKERKEMWIMQAHMVIQSALHTAQLLKTWYLK